MITIKDKKTSNSKTYTTGELCSKSGKTSFISSDGKLYLIAGSVVVDLQNGNVFYQSVDPNWPFEIEEFVDLEIRAVAIHDETKEGLKEKIEEMRNDAKKRIDACNDCDRNVNCCMCGEY